MQDLRNKISLWNIESAPQFNILLDCAQIAKENKFSLYIIGGYVRDFILNPNKLASDIDFVTEGDAELVATLIQKKIAPKSKLSVFKTYGTAHFQYKGIDFEFVSARKESYSPETRNPTVEQGSLEDDQKRRDFTINALAISLNDSDFGTIIDPFNGIEDLKNGIIRTPLVPVETFSDDPLRMLRSIRFASRLNFTIEPKTLQGIHDNAERILIITPERITEEFQKIMASPKPSVGIGLLQQVGILRYFLPELSDLEGVEEVDGQSHKENFWHTLEVLDNVAISSENIWLRWAALLHDIGKPRTKKFIPGIGFTFHGHEFLGSKMAKEIFKRMRMPLGTELKYVSKLVMLSSRPIALVTDDASDSALRRLLADAGQDLDDLFQLCRADITTKNKQRKLQYLKNFDHAYTKIQEVEARDQIKNFQTPVTGEMIMDWFGLKPGKEIGVLKNEVREAILEGVIPNEYEAAKKFVFEKAKALKFSEPS